MAPVSFSWPRVIDEDNRVSAVDRRRSRVSNLIGDRPLRARSVLATALLGADQPRLTVGELVAIASLVRHQRGAHPYVSVADGQHGNSPATTGATRSPGDCSERRQRVDDASRLDQTAARRWDGTWELAIVSVDRRPASEQLELRKAATALHLAELREGVWIRPDNLDPQRLQLSREVLDQQCTHFHRAGTDITAETMRSLFDLDAWADDAARLSEAMEDELDAADTESAGATGVFTRQFALSIAVVRHLQLDPLLPVEFTGDKWPGKTLREVYRRFDTAFKQRMNNAFRQSL